MNCGKIYRVEKGNFEIFKYWIAFKNLKVGFKLNLSTKKFVLYIYHKTKNNIPINDIYNRINIIQYFFKIA